MKLNHIAVLFFYLKSNVRTPDNPCPPTGKKSSSPSIQKCYLNIQVYLLSLFLTLGLSGCLEDKPNQKEQPPTPEAVVNPEAEKPLSAENFKIDLVPAAAPNRYELKITSPKSTKKLFILENNSLVKALVTGQQTSVPLTGGSQHRFSIQERDDSEKTQMSFEYDVLVPLDMVFSGTQKLQADLNFRGGRVFMSGRAELQIGEHTLEIEATDFISDDAVIMTYPVGTAAAARNENARPAGRVNIRTERSSGKLSIQMRGMNGGDGKDAFNIGLAYCLAANGGSGGNSGSAQFYSADDYQKINLQMSAEQGHGGRAGVSNVRNANADPATTNTPASNCQAGNTNPTVGSEGSQEKVCMKLGEHSETICH